MVVRTINVENDYFQPTNEYEEILSRKVPYLSAMGALLFLSCHTRLNISFPLNLLARYSSCLTRRHWSGMKQIFCYLQGQESPTVVHEDNATCIAQPKDEYIKGDKTKHILPKFLFTHDLQKSGDIIVQKVRSSDNQTDLFTKALPTTTSRKLVHGTGMRRLNELKLSNHHRENIRQRENIRVALFFLSFGFVSQGFPSKVFNEATHLSV
ncbi:hypothetical protein Tco_0475139 [Tanacetum coccineum]